MEAYSKAGAHAEEVFSNIKTVHTFGGQKKEAEVYDKLLNPAKRAGILRNLISGVSGGIIFLIMYAVYGIGFWYGINLILEDSELRRSLGCGQFRAEDEERPDECLSRYSPQDLVIVFHCVLLGGLQVGYAVPYIEAITTAQSAASDIFKIIRRVPVINSLSDKGMKPVFLDNSITIRNVSFTYPTRKVQVLTGLSLQVRKGQTVALVGPSGCGKSTVLNLLQRFYDPDNQSGFIMLDDVDIKLLSVGWLRDKIGVVSQEPVMFDMTILENIRVGRSEVTKDEVVRAAKEANAFDFIMKLPKQFDTQVGEKGDQLSGGQKQRIAIARALVRNPSILLLDEATSSLDVENEKIVQVALEKARAGRTTIMVAHRLSTVRSAGKPTQQFRQIFQDNFVVRIKIQSVAVYCRHADKIFVLSEGRVVEEGSHQDLMQMNGVYAGLAARQEKYQNEVEQISLESLSQPQGESPELAGEARLSPPSPCHPPVQTSGRQLFLPRGRSALPPPPPSQSRSTLTT